MILESMVALIGGLVVKVGTDIATNIENRIINAAIDVVNQKQLPSLTTLEWYVSDLQREQKNIRADQRKQIEEHYKTGKDLLSSAQRTGKKKHRIELIKNASEKFIAAKNLEVGKAAAEAALLTGACFHLLYCINDEYGTDNENFWYDEAFRLAESSLGPDRKPSRELMEQLLRLPYLSGKHGTFEVYWKKWEPKLIDAPKSIGTQPPLSGEKQRFHWPSYRKCVSCGKDFYVPPTQFPEPLYCPECSPKLLGKYRGILSQAKQYTFRKTCSWCHKEFDAPLTQFPEPLYCPECKSKYRWLK